MAHYGAIYKKKQANTSAIYKYLYETKLLSLLYFRAIHDDTIRNFYLATNVENIGLFGNICFKASIRGYHKPVFVFIQAEHKIYKRNTKTLRIDYAKYFNGYLKIRQRFDYDSRIKDLFFENTFDETECLFVIFTNAEVTSQYRYTDPRSDLSDKLNELLDAGGTVNQVDNDVNIEYITKMAVRDQIISLAQQIARFINDNMNFQMMLVNELILRYHVILAQKVFDVSDIQPLESEDAPRYRIASFRQDVFDNTEEYIMLFRDTLYSKINKLRRTRQIDVSRSTVNKAVELPAIKKLSSLKFKVPVAFGNKDLTLRGSDAKIDKRISYFTYKIVNLLEGCKNSKLVTIDEYLGQGFLQHNGGIAGAIGNIFVLDDNTKLMKITDNCETLETFAKRLYTKMNSVIKNLHEYKFKNNVRKLPKLSFDPDDSEENLAKDFLSKFIIYSRQGQQRDIERILKHEIEEIQCNQPNSFQAQTDAIYSRYYDEIQQWYMFSKESPYLTGCPNLFLRSIDNIFMHPLMSSINFMYSRSKLQQHDYRFTEGAVRSLNLPDQPSSTIIVAENCVLTVVKLLQHLKYKQEHLVLDLEYIASLSNDDLRALCKELELYRNYKKVLILVCDGIKSIPDIAEMFDKIPVIIITNDLLEILHTFFRKAENILSDKKCNLIDMCEESQKSIFETATAAFPGVEIGLDHLLRGWPKTDLQSAEAAAVADKGTATGSRGVEDEE